MAAYCVIADVQAEIQNTVFNTTTRPTAAQVTQFIADISGEMDAIFIANAIVLPVTDANALLLLKRVCLLGTKSRVYGVMGMEVERERDYWKMYQAELRRLEENPWIANPAGTRQDVIQHSMPPAGSSVFKKGVPQW